MAKNANLGAAKNAKNDEFYTQYADIQKEVNAYIEYNPDVFRGKTILLPCDDPEWSNFTKFFAQNFEFFGLRKLISTSYAIESKKYQTDWQPTLFETENPLYNADKSRIKGKIFTLTHDTNNSGRIDIDDLEWQYLEGDGDFRSAEVTALRDEADIIITNPPFSLFREFLAWIMGARSSSPASPLGTRTSPSASCKGENPIAGEDHRAPKQFLIIGNMNAITYKEVFPLIKENKIWLGNGFAAGNAFFRVSGNAGIDYAEGVYDADTGLVKFRNVCWFTNLDHGRRHQPLQLMTMADNIKFSRHKEIKGIGYQHYDNYDAIEVPYTDAIPSDYVECLGVPISFLDKYSPEQFTIIGATESEGKGFSMGLWNPESGVAQALINGERVYKRIFIKANRGGVIISELREYVINTYGYSPEEVTIISGIMGVPISFLDKYCPEQFEIVGIDGGDMGVGYGVGASLTKQECAERFAEHKGFRRGKLCYRDEEGKLQMNYRRILIRKRQ